MWLYMQKPGIEKFEIKLAQYFTIMLLGTASVKIWSAYTLQI